MSGSICLVIIVTAATLLWVIAKWALAENGNVRVFGFYVSVTACLGSLAILLARNGDMAVGPVWIAGLFLGVAYAIGFIVLIMRCLQIGPAGPTATVNNSAMICGVLFSILYLDPHVPSGLVILGVIGTVGALVLIGMGRQRQESVGGPSIDNRWLPLVLAGGALSGLSFMSQAYVGTRYGGPDHAFLFCVAGFGSSALILLALVRDRKQALLARREAAGGILLGAINAMVLPLTLRAVGALGAEIVFPITVTTPMLLVLIIGRVAYGEKLNRLVWTGCILAAVSVAVLSRAAAGAARDNDNGKSAFVVKPVRAVQTAKTEGIATPLTGLTTNGTGDSREWPWWSRFARPRCKPRWLESTRGVQETWVCGSAMVAPEGNLTLSACGRPRSMLSCICGGSLV